MRLLSVVYFGQVAAYMCSLNIWKIPYYFVWLYNANIDTETDGKD